MIGRSGFGNVANALSNSERIFNITAGLSVLLWSALGMLTDANFMGITPVRLCISLLNLLVGLLFLTRSPLLKPGAPSSLIISLPSLLIAGLAFKLAPPTDLWPIYAELVFVTGALFTFISFIYLGRNFAVLPAVRGIVTQGPYLIIRHPAYAGEMLMIIGCFIAHPTLISVWPCLAAFPAVILRINAEEKILKEETVYQSYARHAPYRLLPGIW